MNQYIKEMKEYRKYAVDKYDESYIKCDFIKNDGNRCKNYTVYEEKYCNSCMRNLRKYCCKCDFYYKNQENATKIRKIQK